MFRLDKDEEEDNEYDYEYDDEEYGVEEISPGKMKREDTDESDKIREMKSQSLQKKLGNKLKINNK